MGMRKLILILCLTSLVNAEIVNPFNVHLVERLPGGLVSVVGFELNLRSVLLELAEAVGKNIIFTTKVEGRVSLSLQQASVKDAMFAALAGAELSCREFGNVLYIGKELVLDKIYEKYHKQQNTNKKYTLENIAVDKFISQLLKQQLIARKDIKLLDKTNNSFILKNIEDETIVSYIKAYDVITKQVRIKAYIVSIDQDYLHELGIDFQKSLQMDAKSQIKSGKINNLAVKLRAIDAKGHGELLSSPELITRDKHTAFIETGEEIPYIRSAAEREDSIVFKKAVLGLKVLPRILPKNKVDMQITIKQDQPGEVYASALSIRTRKIDTDTIVKSGETLVLGGIFEQHKTTSVEGVPILQEIPLVGRVFSKENTNNKKRQLLIFITPEIISSS